MRLHLRSQAAVAQGTDLSLESARRRYTWRPLLVGIGVALILGMAAATQGTVDIPLRSLFLIVASKMPLVDVAESWPRSWDTIVWELRLPRVASAGLVGLALALSGATYQGLFRNPLADPYLIGVASGAALGAVTLMLTPLPTYAQGMSLVPLGAFMGAMMAAAIAYSLARVGGVVPTTTLILAGVAVTSLASAVTTFLLMNSQGDVRPVLSWLLGSFAGGSWRNVLILLAYLVPTSMVLLAHGRILNVLQLDEEQAQQLGIRVERTKLLLVAAASLATAAAVSMSGLIGFVGIIAPHAVRMMWGPDYRFLLPMAAILGAATMILADLGARTVLSPSELPVGVVTALLGAPFFLYLLRQSKRAVF